MPESQGKTQKRKKAKKNGKNSDHSADSEKGLQVQGQQPKAPGTVEVIPPIPESEDTPQWGGQNKIVPDDIMCARAEKYAGIGMDNLMIAAALEMHKETLRLKCIEYPQLALAINRGRAMGANNVAQKFYSTCMNDKHPKQFEAQKFYLERRGGWGEKTQVELTGADGGAVEVENKWTIEIIPAQIKGEEEK